MLIKRTMDEMITHFNDTVSAMDISRKDKMTLLGMITAIGFEYQKAADAIEELSAKYEKALHDLGKQAEPPKEEPDMDKIFLLSKEEYKQHKDAIPTVKMCWWLRSPSADFARGAGVVDYDGAVHDHYVLDDWSVRPALHLESSESSNLKIGDRLVRADFPWIVIGDGLAIAEVPIGFWRFDENSNDYETSEIRKKLLAWWEERTKEEA